MGKSVDFSSRGLNIALSSPLALKRDDVLSISFPRLQQMDKRAPLENVPYRVIRISRIIAKFSSPPMKAPAQSNVPCFYVS